MENWQHLGLEVMQNKIYDASSREISKAMEQTLPDFKTETINFRKKGKGYSEINKKLLEEILTKELTKNYDKKLLTITGHGTFHHLAYALCQYADKISKSYVHIDKHCDSWRTPEEARLGKLNCANFVPFIMEDTNAQNVLYLGSHIIEEDPEIFEDNLLMQKYEKSISLKENVSGFFREEKLARSIDALEEDVYISIDLDVMEEYEVITGYDRGRLTRDGLFDALSRIKNKRRIIGADIVGYSPFFEDMRKSFEKDPLAKAPGLKFATNEMLNSNYKLKAKQDAIMYAYFEQIQDLKKRSFKLYQDIAEFITK